MLKILTNLIKSLSNQLFIKVLDWENYKFGCADAA